MIQIKNRKNVYWAACFLCALISCMYKGKAHEDLNEKKYCSKIVRGNSTLWLRYILPNAFTDNTNTLGIAHWGPDGIKQYVNAHKESVTLKWYFVSAKETYDSLFVNNIAIKRREQFINYQIINFYQENYGDLDGVYIHANVNNDGFLETFCGYKTDLNIQFTVEFYSPTNQPIDYKYFEIILKSIKISKNDCE